MNCKETLFELITSIEAYPFSAVTFSRPLNDDRKYIFPSDFILDKSRIVQIPIKKKSAELSEKKAFASPGNSYEVTLTWQIRDVSTDTYLILNTLSKETNHLVLHNYGLTSYLVRGDEYGYRFSFSEKDGELDCELVITNIAGAQRIL